MKKIFLSHTSADQIFVEKLTIDLNRAGVKTWYGPWDIKPGESIVEKINAALSSHGYLVIVLSPEAVRSKWVGRELNSTVMRSMSSRNIRVIPVLYKRCKIPPIIADLKYADFTSDYKKGLSGLLSGIGLTSLVPEYLTQPKSIKDVIGNDDKVLQQLFPSTFADFPNCLFKNGKMDVAVIVGSTDRERNEETDRFSHTSTDATIFGTHWSFKRQVTPSTVRDSVRVADISAFLGFSYANFFKTNKITWPEDKDTLCWLDVSVSEDTLQRNLILVGAGDTNVYIALASLAFRQRFGFSLPIRYPSDEQLYFTCDQIFSELSNKTYSRIDDSECMHCGYILMTANPWAPDKVMIFASGIKATGTQAALLALTREGDVFANQKNAETWRKLSGNNHHSPQIPGKILRAFKSHIVKGNEYFSSAQEVIIPRKSRISQRHIITEFEFLE